MNGLGLKAVEPQEWALQQRLAVCRSRYPFEDGHAQLAVSHPPAGLDMALRVHWRGVPLRWLCHRACLAQWLAPRLQEAAFASLPPPCNWRCWKWKRRRSTAWCGKPSSRVCRPHEPLA
ncbi:hypothetical protein [Pseudomonas lundensis]|uniref:hypothetical protein n=1 Tax=Pseudomonas lundensis TaxID=86185 RepID=UPI002078C828|nr:hypothetical protein [Pseudomonas lundensis]